MIRHYIEDEKIIPALLDYGWIVLKETWTDCPLSIQKKIKKEELATFFLGNNPKLVKQNQEALN